MGKIVRTPAAALQTVHPLPPADALQLRRAVGHQIRPGQNLHGLLRRIDHPLPKSLQNGFGHADVAAEKPVFCVAVGGACPANIEFGLVIAAEKCFHAVGVVIVGMGQHRRVHASKVKTQLRRVGGKQARRSGVQQDALFAVLYIDAQPPLPRQGAVFSVVYHHSCLHVHSPFLQKPSKIQLQYTLYSIPFPCQHKAGNPCFLNTTYYLFDTKKYDAAMSRAASSLIPFHPAPWWRRR